MSVLSDYTGRKAKNMKTWKIPVTWEMCGIVEVEANTLEEAMELALDNDVELPEGDYVDDSFDLSMCEEDCIRSCYNNNQEDCGKKYSISLVGYRRDNTVTDFDQIIEDLDDLFVAKETYYGAIEMYRNGENDPFANAPDDVAYVVLQLEEGYETDDGFFVTDIIEEETICRKEEDDNG